MEIGYEGNKPFLRSNDLYNPRPHPIMVDIVDKVSEGFKLFHSLDKRSENE